jgi:hypothetical protein
LKAWDTEKQRYELKTVGTGVVAYMLKPTERASEPPHWLCPSCYAKGQKAFLQATGVRVHMMNVYKCVGCGAIVSAHGEPKWAAE